MRSVQMLFLDPLWINNNRKLETHLGTTERQWEKFQYILVRDCVTTTSRGNLCYWVLFVACSATFQSITVPTFPALLTRITFSMSFDWHQWNIPVESYLLTFMSMFSICSFPGISRGSWRLRRQNNTFMWDNFAAILPIHTRYTKFTPFSRSFVFLLHCSRSVNYDIISEAHLVLDVRSSENSDPCTCSGAEESSVTWVLLTEWHDNTRPITSFYPLFPFLMPCSAWSKSSNRLTL